MAKKSFKGGQKKAAFLSTIPREFIQDSNISKRCKFNFSYLDITQTNTGFINWNEGDENSKLPAIPADVKNIV